MNTPEDESFCDLKPVWLTIKVQAKTLTVVRISSDFQKEISNFNGRQELVLCMESNGKSLSFHWFSASNSEHLQRWAVFFGVLYFTVIVNSVFQDLETEKSAVRKSIMCDNSPYKS